MKLWILGADGLVGSALKQLCIEKDIKFSASNKIEADISDFNSLKNAFPGATHIINCAAYTNVDKAELEPDLAYRINAEGAKNAALIAKEQGARFIHLSTDYVFDGQKARAYEEDDSCNPLSVYAKSKLEGEREVLKAYPQSCILRTSWVFGKGGKNFLSSLLTLMQTKEEITIDATQTSRVTYCLDLARAILELLPFSNVFHFANSQECSRLDVAQELYEIAKERKIPLKCQKIIPSYQAIKGAPRPLRSVLSTERFALDTKSKPRSWQDALKEYVLNA
jgi:dTDP-4-dehydrorhamnose reductase